MIWILLLCFITFANPLRPVAAATPNKLTYGKYYSVLAPDINSYYLFTPDGHDPATTKLPVIVEIHGGGFTSGAATRQVNRNKAK